MFAAIANTFSNCFKIPELKSRIIFTLVVLGIARLASLAPVPGLDSRALQLFLEQNASSGQGGLVGLYSLFTGGGFGRCAIGALGIMPYISATIVLQLLSAVVPQLSKMVREEGGRTKFIQYGRYLAVILALGQGFFMALSWENPSNLPGFGNFTGDLLVGAMKEHVWLYRFQTMLILAGGTVLLMWLGEQITDRGVGNGVSLIITISILSAMPKALLGMVKLIFPTTGSDLHFNPFVPIALVLLLIAVIAGVVAVTQGQRKIPVQYAQRAIGRKIVSGGSSFMPLRVNYAGVMPVIFANAILMFPEQILRGIAAKVEQPEIHRWVTVVANSIMFGTVGYIVLLALMILFFSYFWVATQFNELQIADDMKKSGGYIPGIRPGAATSDFLHGTMSRITLAGAVFLTIIAVIPIILASVFNIDPLVGQFFGGTSMLITVGVILDTMRQMESYLLMRHYDGFLKKGRLKGRF
jgi:preprotein translocase subunit SecY